MEREAQHTIPNPWKLSTWTGILAGIHKKKKHLVTSKKAVKFESKRADWCTFQNFETMYNDVYEEMVRGGIAMKLNAKVKLSKEGGLIVEHAHEAFGLETKYDLI